MKINKVNYIIGQDEKSKIVKDYWMMITHRGVIRTEKCSDKDRRSQEGPAS